MDQTNTNPYGLGGPRKQVAGRLPDDRHIAFDVVEEIKISYLCPDCGRANSNRFDVVEHKITLKCKHCSYTETARVVVDIKPSIKS